MRDTNLVVLQVCSGSIAAEVLVGYLKSESIPAVAHNLAPFPGLEQGTEVLVPRASLPRARWLLEQQQPSDSELAALAMGMTPDPSEAD